MIKQIIKKFFTRKPRTQFCKKNNFAIISYKQHKIDRNLLTKGAITAVEQLQFEGFQAYIVGGAVRDLILGMKPKDFDVATNATPQQIKNIFRRARVIGKRFQIVHLPFAREIIEVTTFRGNGESAPSDEHGRILRDNLFGSQQDDASRRDFTVNALYYDPQQQTVIDYHNGLADIKARKLRMIGDPSLRYREDPVRMLRAVRLAAKLSMNIDEASYAPIKQLSDLLLNVPAARLFDEMLKIFTSGYACKCINMFREMDLLAQLLPLLANILSDPFGEKFVMTALASSDQRVSEGKSVSLSFLMASLLWLKVKETAKKFRERGEYPFPALQLAMDEVIAIQAENLAIPRRISIEMKNIWTMQLRFYKRQSRSAFAMINNEGFRAGYDFLLLRESCEDSAIGETEEKLAQWWDNFYHGNNQRREDLLLEVKPNSPNSNNKKRRKKKVLVTLG